MAKEGISLGSLLGVGALVVIIVVAAQYGAFNPANWPSWATGAGGGVVTTTATATPPPATAGLYSGNVAFNVTARDGDSKASLTLTGAIYWALHADESYAGTPAGGVSTNIPISVTDAGHMILAIRYLTTTVGFVDPIKTIAQNPDYMSSMYLKDLDKNGQYDQCYPLDFKLLHIAAGQTVPSVTIILVAWQAQTNAIVITAQISPTGMNTPGDYHATGYIATWTETYALQVERIFFSANTTAAATWGDEFNAGTTTLKAFTLRGVGAQTQTVYGQQWLQGDFNSPSYDGANQRWDVFKAHNPQTGAVDISQVNYGLTYIYERQSGTGWCAYDVWIHTTGDMTGGSTYEGTINIVCTNPAGTQWTETLTIVFTG